MPPNNLRPELLQWEKILEGKEIEVNTEETIQLKDKKKKKNSKIQYHFNLEISKSILSDTSIGHKKAGPYISLYFKINAGKTKGKLKTKRENKSKISK